jgi:hypothetical protein
MELWSRFYTYDSRQGWQLQYPMPYSGAEKRGVGDLSAFLSATVQTTSSFQKGTVLPGKGEYDLSVSLRDSSGQWAGVLQALNYNELSQYHLIEIVAILSGRARNSMKKEKGLVEWYFNERPKDGV